MKRVRPVLSFALAWCAFATAWVGGSIANAAPGDERSAIVANDNRTPAGTLAGKTLALDLDVTTGRWFPDGPQAPSVVLQAFAERGHAPQTPGPLVRVPVGTDIRIRLRNTLANGTLVVHNLVDLPSTHDRPIAIPSGTERIVRFRAYAPGTYYYWATTTAKNFDERAGDDAQLSGAIVVDPVGARANDRIFVIGTWDGVHRADGSIALAYEVLTINGRAWPATERLSYAQGESVRWRWINTTGGSHPMHLHGFPFAVSERGNGLATRRIGGEGEVTERLGAGETSAFAWTAMRPGTWMFHCHLAYHIIAHQPWPAILAGKPTLDFVATQKRAMAGDMDMNESMGGLILGVEVRRDPHIALAPAIAPTRHLRLDVAPQPAPKLAADAKVVPALTYALYDGGRRMPANGAGAPAIVLARGEPVGIDIFNHLDEATTVHWHGIEMQDPYYDGPVGFLNARKRSAPAIRPGGTFEARFVPTRAGTFIYHAHMDDVWQVAGGLAGPLIVLEPGETFDAARDHIVMLTTPNDARYWGTGVNVNGALAPTPLAMAAGTPQRLRLINLTTFDADIVVRLTSTDAPPMAWRLRARDGIDLAAPRPAPRDVGLTIGSTRDLVFLAPHGGHYALEILPDANSPAYVKIPIELTGDRVGLQ